MGDLNKVIAAFKELKITPRIDSFEGRLGVQKLTYLLQAAGFDTGYKFSLYLHGPYSYDLNGDYINKRDKFENLNTDYELTANDKKIVNKVGDIVEGKDSGVLEAAATIIYEKLAYDPNVETKIRDIKPHIPALKVIEAVDVAKSILYRDEYLTDEIKKEFELWDRVQETVE